MHPTMPTAPARAAKAPVVDGAAKKFAVNAEMHMRKRGPKFSDAEDIALCRAFVDVSQARTSGNNQKQDVFWTKIVEKFMVLILADGGIVATDRTWQSLLYRYLKSIKKPFQKFLSLYKQVEAGGEEDSGWNEQMHLDSAQAIWKDCEDGKGKQFKQWHLVEILLDCPKFAPMMEVQEGKAFNPVGQVMGQHLTKLSSSSA